MSKETVKLIGYYNKSDIEMQLAIQCAPVIAGIKIANLLIVQNKYVKEVYHLLRNTEISVYTLSRSEEKTIMILYRKMELLAYLNSEKVNSIIIKMGYHSMEIDSILREFSKKYTQYLRDGGIFPHEMGLLLGYPVEDVTGFIHNAGKNFLYAGYWKVYFDVEEKLETFHRYNQVKEQMIHMVYQGIQLQDIINFHITNQKVAV